MSSQMVQKGNNPGWSPYVKVYDPLKAGSIDGTDSVPHDNAVLRAMSAVYNPPDERTLTSNPSHTLFVGRLNLRTSERQLNEEFSQYGQVKSCCVVQDIVTGISRGYGFVEFKKDSDAQKAWRLAHGSTFHERQILVEWEFARTMPGWIPRRLGGGLGGQKESGQLRFGGRDRPFKKPFIVPPEQENSPSTVEFQSSYQSFEKNLKGKDRFNQRDDNVHVSRSYYNRNEKDKRGSWSRKSFDEDRGKSWKYPEEQYSDHYHQEESRDYKEDSQEKYADDQGRRKYRGDSEEDYGEQNYYSDRNYRGETEQKYADQYCYEQERRKYRRGAEEEEYNEQYYFESRKNHKRFTENRLQGQNYYEDKRTNYRNHKEEKYCGQYNLERKGEHHRRRFEGERHTNDNYDDERFKSSGSGYYEGGEKVNKDINERTNRSSGSFTAAGQRASGSKIPKDEDMYQSESTTSNYETLLRKKRKRDVSCGSSSSLSPEMKSKHKKSKHRKKKCKSDSDSDLSPRSKSKKSKKKKKKKKKSKKNNSSDEDTN